MKKLVIVGAGGMGREAAWTVARINEKTPTWELVGFIDDDPELQNRVVEGVSVLGDSSAVPADCAFHCAIGNNAIRQRVSAKLMAAGLTPATLIDPSAIVAPNAQIGEGSYVGINAILSLNAKLGTGCLVNFRAVVGHDVSLGDYCQLCPGVCLGGACQVGRRVLFGTLAGAIQLRTIGDDAVVGAGVVTCRDIAAGATVARLG